MTIVDMNDTLSTVQTAGGQPKKDLPPSMVERMTLILDAFDGRAARLTLEEVACRTQLPRSTVHRILDQLVKLDWVDHASFGYCLGRRALGLGGGDGGHSQIREAAAPLLHELHLQTGMVVHLSVLDGRESVYLDKVGGRFAAALPSRVGGRVLAHSTAGGKAMLAWIDPERVDALFGSSLPPLYREHDHRRRCAPPGTEPHPSASGTGLRTRGVSAWSRLCGFGNSRTRGSRRQHRVVW